jgi:hypothetical protein
MRHVEVNNNNNKAIYKSDHFGPCIILTRQVIKINITLERYNYSDHRLSINRPTKRGKEKCPSDGHCQCEKEIDNHSDNKLIIIIIGMSTNPEREPHSDTAC